MAEIQEILLQQTAKPSEFVERNEYRGSPHLLVNQKPTEEGTLVSAVGMAQSNAEWGAEGEELTFSCLSPPERSFFNPIPMNECFVDWSSMLL